MEKRKFSRVKYETMARVICPGLQFTGALQDISLYGLYVSTEAQPMIGADALIDIFPAGMENEPLVQVEGTIVRAENGGVAIKVTRIDLDSFVHLRNIVAYNLGDVDTVMDELYRAVVSKQDAKV